MNESNHISYWTQIIRNEKLALDFFGSTTLEPSNTCPRGPLSGVRVLDLTSVILGPYATQILADLGADVIKIEPPEGDAMRHAGPMREPGMGPLFLHSNRGKRSLVLDLKTPQDKAHLMALAHDADVFITNVRPAAMARLGLTYDDFARHNPRIIYAICTGFRSDGELAGRPAYDDLIQGASGLADLMAAYGGGEPAYVPLTLSDRISGLHAVYAVTAALYHRAMTGEGQQVEIPMYEIMAQLVLSDHLGGLSYDPPLDDGGYARLLTRNRKPYATRDGHICAVIYQEKHWQAFFKAIDDPDAPLRDARFSTHTERIRHSDFVYGYVADVMKTRTTAQWQALLDAADIPNIPMQTLGGLLQDAQLRQSGLLRDVGQENGNAKRTVGAPVKWSVTHHPGAVHAPRLGEHSTAILGALAVDAPRAHPQGESA